MLPIMHGLRQANPRRQGDIGEISAADWLTRSGYGVWIPLGHSPDIDLLAQRNDRFLRIQVKTATVFRNGRYEVALVTKGGNQSWAGRVKNLNPARYDFLFVLVADGRKWFIPAGEVGGKTAVLLGGPKYAAFEVDLRQTCGASPAFASAPAS
jgi:Holliday junction resolvase-like predicted endonuclease